MSLDFPRQKLGHFPTPIEYLQNVSSHLGGPKIYIKRDDCTGLAFGGNKTRHLEFIMAKTINSDYDCIITGATTQSNWCRQTIAAANKFKLVREVNSLIIFLYLFLIIYFN